MKVSKGDEVVIICGKDKGKKGVVKCVLTKANLVIVEGLNKFKKALKVGNGNNEHFVEKERPIHSSKVKIVNKNKKKDLSKKQKGLKKDEKTKKVSLKSKVK